MPWFKVDDGLSDHPKVLMAGNPAMGLWVRAGAWAMKHLTDGFIPSAVVALLGDGKQARALVAAGLWADVDGGYRFHEWEGRQPSKEAVQRDRDAAAERQARARERARESRRDEDVTSPVSNGPPDPTRPDPTYIEEPQEGLVGSVPATPSPFCPIHMPLGPNGNRCAACADAKRAWEAAGKPPMMRATLTGADHVAPEHCKHSAAIRLKADYCGRCDSRLVDGRWAA